MLRHEPSAAVERLLASRVHDLLQIESFVARHCKHEADQLRGTAPADAMLAIAAHAEGTPSALISVCAHDGLRAHLEDSAAGLWVSQLRARVADLWRHRERSYRATLAGLAHGVDLMRIVSLSAGATGKLALAEFSSAWLTTRTALLRRAEGEVAWFARNPEKGFDQRWLGERYGRVETGPWLHPWTRVSGLKGASNVGEDETSGSE